MDLKKLLKATARIIFIVGLAAAGYLVDRDRHDRALIMLQPFGYGWACLSFVIIVIGQKVVGRNATLARRSSGIDRPDQHAYEVVGAKENIEPDLPQGVSPELVEQQGAAVRMASDGALGEFNRAQRAVFNWHESLPVTLMELLLVAFSCGPVSVVMALVIVVGRSTFARGYTKGLAGRLPGFIVAVSGEWACHLLLVILAIRSFTLGNNLPA
mmetsp:Transcript_51834/g.93057  ORF Transcript_51834/g.93057 Transcript_51834/m.93057 type:complete len:213 (+) Transcript_51834:49-687(+)